MATISPRKTTWSRWPRRGLPSALVILLCAGVYWITSFSPKTQVPPLVVPESALNFGEVWEDTAFNWELPIENRGPKAIKLVDLVASCGCITIEPREIEIPGGETRRIRLTLDLSWTPPMTVNAKDQPGATKGSPRDFAVDIRAALDGSEWARLRPLGWTVNGRVFPVVSMDPRGVNFGDTLVEGGASASRLVTLIAHTRLTGLDIKCEPDLVEGYLSCVPREEEECQLVLQTKNGIMAGPLDCAVSLTPLTAHGALPPVRIHVEGQVRSVLGVLPRTYDLGTIKVGTRAQATFWIVTNRPVPVDELELTFDDTKTRTLQVKRDGNKWRVDLERVIDMRGFGQCHGHVRSSPSYGSEEEPLITLRWYGVDPE